MALYDAFISYSHANDKRIAIALQSAVQKLGKPWYARRALRVFRDDASLSATPHLWPSIQNALKESRFLILLASPEAATSVWVNKEAAYWLETKSIDTVLIALTDGELTWQPELTAFGAAAPLPASLKRRLLSEPKWVDLRSYRRGASNSDARFTDHAADLAATIRGIPKDDLLSEEVRQQRRALTLACSVGCLLFVLTGAAGWQWYEATLQRNIAREQRDAAQRVYRLSHDAFQSLLVGHQQFEAFTSPADWQRDFAFKYVLLSSAYLKINDLDGALRELRNGRSIIHNLLMKDRGHPQLNEDLAWFDKQIATLPSADVLHTEMPYDQGGAPEPLRRDHRATE